MSTFLQDRVVALSLALGTVGAIVVGLTIGVEAAPFGFIGAALIGTILSIFSR